MKKLIIAGLVLGIFGLVSLSQIKPVAALTVSESSDSNTTFQNFIASAMRPLVVRIEALEKQVADLFTKLANIQLIPGPKGDTGEQGPKGDKGDKGDAGTSGKQYHLYDANNQDLGLLISVDRTARVFITYLENQKVLLEIHNDSNTSNHSPFIVT